MGVFRGCIFRFFISCLPRNAKLASVGKYNFTDIGRPICLISLRNDMMVAADAGRLQLYHVRNISYGELWFWYYANWRKDSHVVDVPDKQGRSVVETHREGADEVLENGAQVVRY